MISIEQSAGKVHYREEEIQRLKYEFCVIKGEKRRVKFKSSNLDQQAGKDEGEQTIEHQRSSSSMDGNR